MIRRNRHTVLGIAFGSRLSVLLILLMVGLFINWSDCHRDNQILFSANSEAVEPREVANKIF